MYRSLWRSAYSILLDRSHVSCISCSQTLPGAPTRWLIAYRSLRHPWRVLCGTPPSSSPLFATLLLIVPATCDVFRLPCTVRGYEVVLVHSYMRFTKAVHAILNVCILRGKGRCPRALPSELTKYAGQQFVSMSCRGDTALWCPRLKWFEQQHSECGHALANMFVERVCKVQCAVSVCVRVCFRLVPKQGICSDLECMFCIELP